MAEALGVRGVLLAAMMIVAGLVPTAGAAHAFPRADLEERSITALQADLTAGKTTSARLVEGYLARIRAIDRGGPALHSIIALNPDARAQARALDVERAAGHVRGPLHGIPVLIKDNIETLDPVATTAGSLALANNITGRDAPIVARLRAAGAVILGKTNLSEWANIRGANSSSGWSAVGGQTRNPYVLDRNPCGSSSGSGAAVAASLAAAAVGTETDGSVVCPSTVNGLVGIKPTVGLLSRTRIVPISASQDTAGPMARSVMDAAILLTVMAGADPADPATAEADSHRTDYAAGLDAGALAGKRLGVARFMAGDNAATVAAFNSALTTLRAAGAELVELPDLPGRAEIGPVELVVLLTELKHGLNAYLATTSPAQVRTRTLADLIAFNRSEPRELGLFGQELFEQAEATKGLTDPAYIAAAAKARRLAADGIDGMLAHDYLDAIVAPTGAPSWPTDHVLGDHFVSSSSELPAVAGYPHVTVPMGAVSGLPVGLSFIGGAWTEARLIGFAYAFEQRAKVRHAPTYVKRLAE